jgi:hypothetical protein
MAQSAWRYFRFEHLLRLQQSSGEPRRVQRLGLSAQREPACGAVLTTASFRLDVCCEFGEGLPPAKLLIRSRGAGR